MRKLPLEDIDFIFQNTFNIWEKFRDKSVFLTGGTGFFGKWLLESFMYANEKLSLNASMTVLSRNPKKFIGEFPFFDQRKGITFLKGDINDFEFPKEKFSYVIHAATDTDAVLHHENPLKNLETIINGTKRMLDFAKEQPLQSILFTSSGAVYGRQPENVTHVKEDQGFYIDINNPLSAYAEGKRFTELYAAAYAAQYDVPVKIARCFAFVGPHLPLDKHFAIGNFINNTLTEQDIIIKGDGTPHRSYLYAADLVIWLWTILIAGKNNYPYNVGSDESYNIQSIANKVRSVSGKKIQVKVLAETRNANIERYVPDISRAKNELSLKVYTGLEESIRKTILYNLNLTK